MSSGATAARRVGAAVATVCFAWGCASGGGCKGDGYGDVGCRAERARENLRFGLSRDEALARIGSATVVPPWHNEYGVGPETLSNPYDSFEVTSEIGEQYEVVRFFVRAYGEDSCPFIQGRVLFEPLIFHNGKLVGWRWSYLEDVTGEPVGDDTRTWRFGTFCDQLGRDQTGAV